VTVSGVGVTSIDRTAYPRLERVVLARELAEVSPPLLDLIRMIDESPIQLKQSPPREIVRCAVRTPARARGA
jgi:hypothetical protein